MLRRMHVDIDNVRVKFQIQHEDRMAPVVQHIAVGLTNGMRHQPIANNTTVDEEVLLVRLRAGVRGRTDPAPQTQPGSFGINLQGVLHHVLAQQSRDTRFAGGRVIGRP